MEGEAPSLRTPQMPAPSPPVSDVSLSPWGMCTPPYSIAVSWPPSSSTSWMRSLSTRLSHPSLESISQSFNKRLPPAQAPPVQGTGDVTMKDMSLS